MSFHAGYAEPAIPMVGPFSSWSSLRDAWALSVASSGTWEAAGRAVYYPIQVPATCVARRVWWANGATVNASTTIEVGIYADAAHIPGAKLVSGSAAQGTANQVQFADITDSTLSPGIWWLAIMASSATSTTLFRNTTSIITGVDAITRFQEASANPLPATATPAESAAGNIWLCGFSTTTIT